MLFAQIHDQDFNFCIEEKRKVAAFEEYSDVDINAFLLQTHSFTENWSSNHGIRKNLNETVSRILDAAIETYL